jgi:hypothetical protein
MCVRIDCKVKETNKIRFAWKILFLYPQSELWYPAVRPGSFKRGKWERAQNCRYGFNCFATRKGADRYHYWYEGSKVVRVRIRRVHGYGKIEPYRVLFAREIFVPKRKG